MEKKPSGKIMLIDANALIHRAFHALPAMTSPKGELVNAVYGFASTLLRAIKDEKPQYLAICYDAGRHTFRNDLYDGYKAKRQKTAEELYMQIPRTKELVESLSMPIYAQKGVEADDLIGALAKIAAKKGLRTVIVTGDKDTLQLVDDSTYVYSLHRGTSDTLTYDTQVVKEKIGVYPNQIVEYKALAGDNSDNIPGIPGVGDKTAVYLLNKYQTIDNIYHHLDELSDRQRKLFQENKKMMELSRTLATIKTDLKIDLDLEQAEVSRFDFSKAVGFFNQLGFRSLIARLPSTSTPAQSSLFASGGEPRKTPKEPLPHQLIKTEKEWQEVFNKLLDTEKIVFDTETIDLSGGLIGISFAWSAKDSAYLPVNPHYPEGLELKSVLPDLKKLFGDPEIQKIGHNLKFDIEILNSVGIEVNGVWFDTMIASSLINSQLFTQKLDDLAAIELNFRKIPITELIGKEKNKPMSEVPLDELAAYSCEDALITYRLYERFFPQIESQHVKKIFYEIEMPLVNVLAKMEETGIAIDLKHLAILREKLTKRLKELEKEIHHQAGGAFNIASPAQLKEVLFGRLKLASSGVKKVKTGLSTDAETLQKLKTAHPIIPLILEYRELAKLISTYIDTLPTQADKDGRVHTSFMQVGTVTGRLSSNNPNLQNIPIRTELGTDVRRSFVAGKGYQLLGADYSQAELRIVAHLSNDPKMIEAFQSNADIHQAVSDILNVDRRTAKAINFGIIYGLGPLSLAENLSIPMDEAKQFINRYFQSFPHLQDYIDRMHQFAREHSYVETLLGRRRYLPDIHSPNPILRSSAERMAVNMPCQGTVADIVKLAMVRLDEKLPKTARSLLQIHDELLLEVEPKALKEVTKLIKEVMGSVIELKVPLVVDVKTGPNWADLK